jgi:hypothetical protein
MMLQILLFLMLNISPATQSQQLFVASDSLINDNGILYLGSREGWRFQPGDNMNWANPDFDDSDWIYYKPTGLTDPIHDSLWNGFGWFRYRFVADSSAYARISHLYFYTWGAAEVYLDGKLVQKYGVFSTEMKGEKRYLPFRKTYPAIVLHPGESHVMAVRFSYHKGQHYKKLLGKYARTFGFSIGLTNDNFSQQAIWNVNNYWRNFYILSTMMFLIMLLHGFLYLLFPDERSNLYIAIVAFLLFLIIILGYGTLFLEFDILQYIVFIQILLRILFLAALSMFPFTINSLFNQRPRKVHKMLIWLFPFFALANFILSGPGTNIIITIIFASCIVFFSSQVLFRAWRNKQKGVWFVAGAFWVR